MAQLRPDMLPDKSQTEPVVSEDPQTPAPEAAVIETEPQPQAEAPTKPPKGYVSIEALHEERRMRKEAQEKLKSLSSVSAPDTSDEPEQEEPEEVDDSLAERVKRLEKDNLYLRHPELKDKQDEFEAFLQENPEYPLESAAKVFKAENGLYPTTPARQGLERPTGGPKTAPRMGLTPDQIKDLRENYPRKYAEMIRSGKLKPSEVEW